MEFNVGVQECYSVLQLNGRYTEASSDDNSLFIETKCVEFGHFSFRLQVDCKVMSATKL
jgi:hypothetical protein